MKSKNSTLTLSNLSEETGINSGFSPNSVKKAETDLALSPSSGRVGVGFDSDEKAESSWQVSPKLWTKLKPLAREMRKEQTHAEKIIWSIVRKHQIEKMKFRRQHAIDRFIVDFYCSELKLILEIDGEIHNSQKEEDQIRQEFLETLGNMVVRFTNVEVMENPDFVQNKIREVVRKLKTTLPSHRDA